MYIVHIPRTGVVACHTKKSEAIKEMVEEVDTEFYRKINVDNDSLPIIYKGLENYDKKIFTLYPKFATYDSSTDKVRFENEL